MLDLILMGNFHMHADTFRISGAEETDPADAIVNAPRIASK